VHSPPEKEKLFNFSMLEAQKTAYSSHCKAFCCGPSFNLCLKFSDKAGRPDEAKKVAQ
jgi:hypothetical protein